LARPELDNRQSCFTAPPCRGFDLHLQDTPKAFPPGFPFWLPGAIDYTSNRLRWSGWIWSSKSVSIGMAVYSSRSCHSHGAWRANSAFSTRAAFVAASPIGELTDQVVRAHLSVW